jgi:hypothetical protein
MRSAITPRIIVLLCTIISSTLIIAQSTVTGKVSDNSGKGIVGASVTAGGGRGAQTNADGMYSLSLPNGSTTITASFVGYASISKTITINGNCDS